jgi:hypothetical protein
MRCAPNNRLAPAGRVGDLRARRGDLGELGGAQLRHDRIRRGEFGQSVQPLDPPCARRDGERLRDPAAIGERRDEHGLRAGVAIEAGDEAVRLDRDRLAVERHRHASGRHGAGDQSALRRRPGPAKRGCRDRCERLRRRGGG